jgi:hypothetical protein
MRTSPEETGTAQRSLRTSAASPAAEIKLAAGIITEGQHDEIARIVDTADFRDFRPLLYVLPFAPVADRVEAVPLARRASLFHEEYTIERLPRALFDVIEWLEI